MADDWLEQMRRIAEDFEAADVKSFQFTKINEKITCKVVVLNASGEIVVWELVDDAASLERWRRVAAEKADSTRPSDVRQTFLSVLTR